MFSDLITSKTRVKILNIFLQNAQGMLHVRECVRRSGEEINAVRRELLLLEEKGILNKEPRANRVYYSLSNQIGMSSSVFAWLNAAGSLL